MDETLLQETGLTSDDISDAIRALNREVDLNPENLESIAAGVTGLDPADPADAEKLARIATFIGMALAKVDSKDTPKPEPKARPANAVAKMPKLAKAQTGVTTGMTTNAANGLSELEAEGLFELNALLGVSDDVIPVVPED